MPVSNLFVDAGKEDGTFNRGGRVSGHCREKEKAKMTAPPPKGKGVQSVKNLGLWRSEKLKKKP